MLKNTDSTFDVSNITGFFSCDHHKQQVADIFNSWRNDSYTYMTSFGDKMKANKTRKAATTIQSQVRGRQTRKRNNLNRKKRTRGARNIQKFIRGRRTRKKLGSNAKIKRDKALFSEEKKRNDAIIESKKRRENR